MPSYFRPLVIVASLLILISCTTSNDNDGPNELPEDVIAAFSASKSVELFTVDPHYSDGFYGNRILGQTLINQTESATVLLHLRADLANAHGGAMCFEPHHILRLVTDSHTFDLVICYDCGAMEIYRDEADRPHYLNLAGSPELLSELSKIHGIPESPAMAPEAEREGIQNTERKEWLKLMPAPLEKYWNDSFWRYDPHQNSPAIQPLRQALAQKIPDSKQRILALYHWLGSTKLHWDYGAGSVPAALLREFSVKELSTIAQSGKLTLPQLRGAVRLFSPTLLWHETVVTQANLTRALTQCFDEMRIWTDETPASIRPLWTDDMWRIFDKYSFRLGSAEKEKMMTALAEEFPDKNQRILKLLDWYGLGLTLKSGVMSYATIPENFIARFTPLEIDEALQSVRPTNRQIDGAIRYFHSQEFTNRPLSNLKNFPSHLEQLLAEHH